MSAKEKENAYESKFGKKTPTQMGVPEKNKAGGFLDLLGGIWNSLPGLLKIGIIGAGIAGLTKILKDTEIGKYVKEMITVFGEALFGKEYWNDLKLKISKGFEEIINQVKDFAVKVLQIYAGLKIAGVLLNRQLMRLTMAGLPTATRAAITGAEVAAGVGGTAAAIAAKKAIGPTVGRDAISGKFTKIAGKSPTKWTRFLIFLEKNAPKLFAKVGKKLAGITLGAFVPGIGWFLDLVLIGLLVADCYDLYDYWKKFSNDDKDTSPTPIEKDLNSTNLMTNEKGETTPLYSGQSTSGTSPTPIGSPLISSKSSGDIEKAEEYLGRKISSEEWDALSRAVYAESSRNKNEYANVMAVILNRARNSGKSIFEVLTEKNQFQAVTGTVDNPGPSQNYLKGPGPNEAAMILESTSSLASISKDLDAFTSANPKIIGAVTVTVEVIIPGGIGLSEVNPELIPPKV